MIRACILAILCFAGFVCDLSAVEPSYRIIFRNTSGQISLPDEARIKTYFIDLKKVGQKPEQTLGGDARRRFRVMEYREFAMPPTLILEEVATQRCIPLELAVMVDLVKKP